MIQGLGQGCGCHLCSCVHSQLDRPTCHCIWNLPRQKCWPLRSILSSPSIPSSDASQCGVWSAPRSYLDGFGSLELWLFFLLSPSEQGFLARAVHLELSKNSQALNCHVVCGIFLYIYNFPCDPNVKTLLSPAGLHGIGWRRAGKNTTCELDHFPRFSCVFCKLRKVWLQR